MKSFSIQIPNEKATTYNVVTFIIAIINLLAFGFALLKFPPGSPKLAIYSGFILSLLSVLLLTLKKNRAYFSRKRVEVLFILCAFCWIFTGNFLQGLLLMVFALLGFITLNKKLVHFSEEGITYPSFPVRSISWKEVDFVILKDDILTIEMKNNKLMQFTLEKDTNSGVNPDEFNNFCKKQLAG